MLLALLFVLSVDTAESRRRGPLQFLHRRFLRPTRRFVGHQLGRLGRWWSNIDVPGIHDEPSDRELWVMMSSLQSSGPRRKQRSRIVELGVHMFPTTENSKYNWLILFCDRYCAAGRNKLRKIKNNMGHYKLGYVDCQKSKKQQDFCTSHGMDEGYDWSKSSSSSNKYATVLSGQLQFLSDQPSWTAPLLHAHVLWRLSNTITSIRDASDIKKHLLRHVFVTESYATPAVLLYHANTTMPAWFLEIVSQLEYDEESEELFVFGVVDCGSSSSGGSRNQQLKELQDYFVDQAGFREGGGFKVEHFPELLVLLPYPSIRSQVHNVSEDAGGSGQGHNDEETPLQATRGKSSYGGSVAVKRLKRASTLFVSDDSLVHWLRDLKKSWQQIVGSDDAGAPNWISTLTFHQDSPRDTKAADSRIDAEGVNPEFHI